MKKYLVALLFITALPVWAGGNSNNSNNGGNQDQSQSQGQSQNQYQLQGQLQSQSSFNLNSNYNTSSSKSNADANSLSLSNSNSNSKSTAISGPSISGAYSGGNTQSSSVSVDTKVRPAASGPALSLTSVGTDNCLGSASLSGGNGFFTIGGGKTTESVECNRRAYSRALRDLGETKAALGLLCLNDEVAKVDPNCPKDDPKPAGKEAAAGNSLPAWFTE